MTDYALEQHVVCTTEFLRAAVWSTSDAMTRTGYKLPLDNTQGTLALQIRLRLEAGEPCPVSELHSLAFSLIALSEEELQEDRYRCPIQYFLAGYHMHSDGQFSDAWEVLPHFRALLCMLKGIVFHQVSLDKSHFGGNIFRSTEHYCARFLTTEQGCSFRLLWRLHAFALHLARTTPQAPTILWNKIFSQLTCKGSLVDMHRMREGFKKAMDDVEVLMKALGPGEGLPWTPKCDLPIVDDLTTLKAHHSFLDTIETPLSANLLFKSVVEDSSSNFLYLDAEGRILMNSACAMSFMEKAAALNRHLLALCFFLGGQPPNASDILDCQIRNTLRARNLHYVHGHIFLNMEHANPDHGGPATGYPKSCQGLCRTACCGIFATSDRSKSGSPMRYGGQMRNETITRCCS